MTAAVRGCRRSGARNRVAAWTLIPVVVLATAVARGSPAQPASGPARFVGEVARGQTFEREIGGGLVFRLVRDEYGWTIRVGPRANPEPDWSAVVTPPFHGVNHRYIEGWHFRNADNSGPNDIGPNNVNAPQEIREFAFVLTEAEYRMAHEALDRVLWPSRDGEREAALPILEAVEARAAQGRLTITDMTLGNLGVGQHAWIDRMTFEVELLPP